MTSKQKFHRADAEDSRRGSALWAASMEAKESDKVGVEGSCPILLLATGAMGFVLPRRHPTGRYEISWIRLVPMAAMIALLCWNIFTYPIGFTGIAYDKFVDLIPYSACTVLIVYSFVMAIYKRHETTDLFKALEGKLKPTKLYLSIISSCVFLLNAASFFTINYHITDWDNVSLMYLLAMTLVHPVLPLLLDLYVAHMIRGLSQVYKGTAEQCIKGTEEMRSASRDSPSRVFAVLQNKTGGMEDHSVGRISEISDLCDDLSRLVSLHNEIFSGWTFLRCAGLLAKLLNSAYYVNVFFGDWFPFVCSLCYTLNEIISFRILSCEADSLREAHCELEDVLMTLQRQANMPIEDRIHLHGLTAHLRARPARITIGNVGVFGSHVLISKINIALTFTAIVYQYRPR